MDGSRITSISTSSAAAHRRHVSPNLGRTIVLHVFLVLLAFIFIAPFFWTITTSLKRVDEVYLFPPVVFPEYPVWANYPKVFDKVPFGFFFRNTVIISILATVGTVCSTTLVAYGFARRRFPGRQLLFLLVLCTMMLPMEVTIIPQFLLFRELGWIDTFMPLIVPEYFAVAAFYIFLMRQFVMTIPRDFDEAAMLDGANTIQILLRVLLPLLQPAMITVAILSFLAHWNDFFAPFIYLNTRENLTLSVGLRYFANTTGAGAGMSDNEPSEHLLMAASLMAAAPVIALFFVAQRYFVQGIVMSGLKG